MIFPGSKYIDGKYRLGSFFISLAYALLLANVIPMDGSIKDRLNYLAYASDSLALLLRYLSRGYVDILSNEPVWILLNGASALIFEPAMTVKVIIFVSAFVTSYLLLLSNPKSFIFLVFLLVFPQVVGKFVVHIRQGLAISIFLLGWFTPSKTRRWFLFSVTPFIHASFFFVLFLYGLSWLLQKFKFAIDIRTLIILATGVVLGLGLGFIASFLGARQATAYEFEAAGISGVGFVFWLCVFVLYFMQGRSFARAHSFAMAAITFYLSTYFLMEVTGRIFESMLIIVMLASLDLTSWRKKAFIIAITLYVCLSWLMRLGYPWLGWGTGL